MSDTLVTQEETSFKAFEEKLSLLITFSFKAMPLFTSSQGENKADTTLPTALGTIKNNPAPNTDSTAKAKIKSLSPEEKDIIIFDKINATAVPIFPVDEKSPAIRPPNPKPPHKKLSESELKEKKLRIEDALNATKAAVEEGIVIGGGAALVEAYKEVKPQLKSDNVDVQKGIHIVMEALFAPIQQIAENAGYNAEDIVESQKTAQKNYGFDAKNGQWVDMFEKGIIDPTKVTRSALLNACSIASLFITTEAGIADAKDTSKNEVPTPAMY